MKFTEKQKRFCDYYIELGNVTESAIRAGYSKNYANAQGYKLLANVGIRGYIDERLALLEEARIADASEVLRHLTAVMRGEVTEEVVVVEGDGDGCSSARKVRKEVAPKDRIKAAELLGKRHGIFNETVDINGKLTLEFADDYGE